MKDIERDNKIEKYIKVEEASETPVLSKEELIDIIKREEINFIKETKEEIKNLNTVGLTADEFEEIKKEENIEEKLEEINAEAGEIVEEIKDEVEQEGNTKIGLFDAEKFRKEIENKIELAETKEEVLSLYISVFEEQKNREDLKFLFENFKFTNGEGSEVLISNYFDEELNKFKEFLSNEDSLEQLKNISLDDLKKEAFGEIEDVVVPALYVEDLQGYAEKLKRIQDKVKVRDFEINHFVKFLNDYDNLSKGREGSIDKYIFKQYPKHKEDVVYNISSHLRGLKEDPDALEKIDFFAGNNLDDKLKLFSDSEYFERYQGSDDFESYKGSWSYINSLIGTVEGEKGVNVFDVGNSQEKRLSTLNKLSLESLKLAEKNDYFVIESVGPTDAYDINFINEDVLKDIASFDPNIKTISPYQVRRYSEDIQKLEPDVKEFCRKVYLKEGQQGTFSLLPFGHRFFDLSKDSASFNKIKKSYEGGLIKDFYSLNDIIDLSERKIDLLIATGEKYSDIDDKLLESIAALNKEDFELYKSLKEKYNLDDRFRDHEKSQIINYINQLKEIPKEGLDFYNKILSRESGSTSIHWLVDSLFEFLYHKDYFLKLAEFYKTDPEAEEIIFDVLEFYPHGTDFTASTAKKLDKFLENPKEYILQIDNFYTITRNFKKYENLLKKKNIHFEKEDIDSIFENILRKRPEVFFEKNEMPFSDEQKKIISIFEKINNSPSAEMKNMAIELSMQIVQGGEFSTIDERYEKIDNIFVKNNIPFVGKQAKICEALHPNINTTSRSSPELHSLHSNNAKRLLIFKDLLRSSFDSLNSNLEQYLLLFRDGQAVLDKFERGELLVADEEEKLKYFFKKINALSENTRKTDKFNKFDLENLSLSDNLQALKENFGVAENQIITEKFESTFLRRVGINDFNEAIQYFDNRRKAVSERNMKLAEAGQIDLSENDLAKGVSLNYFSSNLDRGIYAPEFVGAESFDAKLKSKQSDATPWDTDLIMVGARSTSEIVGNSTASEFGDAILIIKDRGQFNKTEVGVPIRESSDKPELFKTGIRGEDHFGIRTSFGSTEIDALLIKDNVLGNTKQLDSLKFSIAQKGFYIPICDKDGKVIFTPDDYNEYKKIFSGIDKYHGGKVELNEDWKNSAFAEKIKEFTQTNENLGKISKIKDELYSDIENDLRAFEIELHKGRYDDSVVGAKIIDTGSTGRGAALDSGYDFDFVIKVNDNDASKIGSIAEGLKAKYPFDQSYERDGMVTYRFKSFEKDGNKIDLDISFVKKSDSEELDANEAVALKYDSIKKQYGEDKLLEVLTNVRYAKKELKNAGCYKKGLTGNGEQQGGLGGIGVENWILKNGGDAVVAFREFNKNAYQDGVLISFNDFKNRYKIFSAGSNIRGGIKAENFVYNMDEVGYQKMAELSKKFI